KAEVANKSTLQNLKRASTAMDRGSAPCPLLQASQQAQERDEVLLLLIAQTQLKALVVETDHIFQGRCRSVVEVRCTCSEPAQNRSFEHIHVLPLARDQRAAGVGGLDDFAGRLVPECVERHIGSATRLA